jgi:hypothetical protein
MLSIVVFSFITGVLVTIIGYYTPFIMIGSAIFTIGAGLMTMYTVDMPDWRAYGFSIVAGAGCGLAIQNAFMSVQAVLPPATLSIGNATVMFSQTLSYPPPKPAFLLRLLTLQGRHLPRHLQFCPLKLPRKPNLPTNSQH